MKKRLATLSILALSFMAYGCAEEVVPITTETLEKELSIPEEVENTTDPDEEDEGSDPNVG